MPNLIRTTITLPDELWRWTKIHAARLNLTANDLVRLGINELRRNPSKIKQARKRRPGSILKELAGSLDLGGKEPYNHRSELYEERLDRKFSR